MESHPRARLPHWGAQGLSLSSWWKSGPFPGPGGSEKSSRQDWQTQLPPDTHAHVLGDVLTDHRKPNLFSRRLEARPLTSRWWWGCGLPGVLQRGSFLPFWLQGPRCVLAVTISPDRRLHLHRASSSPLCLSRRCCHWPALQFSH